MILPLLLWVGLHNFDEPQPSPIWKTVVTRRLTEVELPAAVLGKGWRPTAGLKIDDLSKTDGLDVPVRQLAEQLIKSGPPGARGVGDFSLVKTGFPLNTVTVRVFVFGDADQCRAWWTKKYRYDGWEEHYRVVESERYAAVDSLQENKRAAAFGNVWITAHQLGKGDEHLKALTAIVDALTAK